MAAVLSLSDVPSDFSSRYLPYIPSLRQKQRATAFSKGSYIKSMSISAGNDVTSIHVFARIYRSMKKSDEPHQTSIDVNIEDRTITDALCSCKAGMGGRCAHVLAIIIMIEEWKIAGYKDVPSQPSSTSLPQQWDKPRGSKIEPDPVSHIIISRPGNVNRKRKPVMANFNDNRKIQVSDADILHLQTLKDSPISYLVSSTADSITTPIGPQLIGSPLAYHAPLMQVTTEPRAENSGKCGEIAFPKPVAEYLDLEQIEKMKVEWKEIDVNQDEAIKIERSTRNNNNTWMNQRKCRITASNFGAVMKRKKEINDSFLKNTFHKSNFYSVPTSYGQANETIAKQMYIKQTGNHIHDIGLVINPALPFLGATPDAIVCDKGETGLIEIKCPFSARDITLTEACNTLKDFFLVQNEAELKLSRNHIHWFQVQGQLLVTGAQFCDFVTFTRQDFCIERIYPEKETMQKLVSKLSCFYVEHLKPFLIKNSTCL